MQRTILIGTFVFIVLRAYLYFTSQQELAAILDLALLPVYAILCIADRQYAYIGIIAYLPASSIFYLPTGLIPFDLSLPIILMATTVLSRDLPKRKLSKEFRLSLAVYGLLCVYLFLNIFFESMVDSREIREQIKIFYLLFTAATAGLLFSKIYDPQDSRFILNALILGLVAYVFAGCLGYLFPLSTYTWQLDAGQHFKTLFRYPGLSNSNYIAHVVLVLIAVHSYVSQRAGRRVNPIYYLGVIGMVAVISQSRSFVATAIVMLLVWWVLRTLHLRISVRTTKRSAGHTRSLLGLGLLAVVVIGMFSSFFLQLGQQTVNRLSLTDSSTINISRRFDEWRAVHEHFEKSERSWFRGNISYPDSLRPHNVILSSILIFGIPIALVLAFLIVVLVFRVPLLFFMFLGAQAEILFATGVYDFLFLIFLTVLCSKGNGTQPNNMATSN